MAWSFRVLGLEFQVRAWIRVLGLGLVALVS